MVPDGESEPCKSGGQGTRPGEQRHGKDLKVEKFHEYFI